MNKNKITGIVLAGGKSRRMGTEKGLLKLGGKHLIEYAIEILEKVCGRILISENSDTYDFLGYPVIADIVPNSGPMGGIYSGLMNSETDLNLVLSCDMPFISEELLNYLINNSEGFDVAVPWLGEERFEPMCALYHKNTIPVFEQFIQSNNYKIQDVYRKLKTNKLLISAELKFYKPFLFDNLNSKQDLEQANLKLDEILPRWDRLLLIAGTGRNAGKTTLACEIVEQTSKDREVIGVKISPHIHTQNEGAEMVFSNDHFSVFREWDKRASKDSSRMLRAGAKQVFYIQSEDKYIGEAFQMLSKEFDFESPIVCESGGLRNFVVPSVFLICGREGNTSIKEKLKPLIPKANRMLQFKDPGFDFDISKIKFENGGWKLGEE